MSFAVTALKSEVVPCLPYCVADGRRRRCTPNVMMVTLAVKVP